MEVLQKIRILAHNSDGKQLKTFEFNKNERFIEQFMRKLFIKYRNGTIFDKAYKFNFALKSDYMERLIYQNLRNKTIRLKLNLEFQLDFLNFYTFCTQYERNEGHIKIRFERFDEVKE